MYCFCSAFYCWHFATQSCQRLFYKQLGYKCRHSIQQYLPSSLLFPKYACVAWHMQSGLFARDSWNVSLVMGTQQRLACVYWVAFVFVEKKEIRLITEEETHKKELLSLWMLFEHISTCSDVCMNHHFVKAPAGVFWGVLFFAPEYICYKVNSTVCAQDSSHTVKEFGMHFNSQGVEVVSWSHEIQQRI